MKNDPKPRAKPYSKSIGTGDPAGQKEKAYLKATYTVFLGRSVHEDGGGFDYWGNPESGSVITVGIKDNWSSAYGDAWHWSDQVRRRPDLETTTEGRGWTSARFNPRLKKPGNPHPPKRWSVRCKTTGGTWRSVASELTKGEAAREAKIYERKGYESCVFEGRRKAK